MQCGRMSLLGCKEPLAVRLFANFVNVMRGRGGGGRGEAEGGGRGVGGGGGGCWLTCQHGLPAIFSRGVQSIENYCEFDLGTVTAEVMTVVHGGDRK